MKVELQNVSFEYKGEDEEGKEKIEIILDNVSFTIDKSDCVAIVGSSGSGKSTLLRLIGGILPNANPKIQNFSGKILIDELDITREKLKWKEFRAKGHLGFMFQDPNLLPNLTVEENIYLPLKIIGNTTNGDNIVSEYLQITGLDKHKNKLPHQLSGGMRTRVALARTFITKPQLLLLDEPFSSLDMVWKSILYNELKDLRREFKTTVVLVTHDIFEAMFFSDDIIVLGDDHKILDIVKIEDWDENISYNEVIQKHHQDFVLIKDVIKNRFVYSK